MIGLLVGAFVLAMPQPIRAQADENSSTDAGASTEPSNAGSVDASGSASDPTDIALWLFRDDALQEGRRVAFRAALERALADTKRRHILSREKLASYLDDHSAPVPKCLSGLRPCISPQALVFDQLDLSALVRVRVRATDDGMQAQYRLINRRGATGEEATLEAPDPQKLAFALVRELFDATGTAAFRSTPEGATVQVDGETVGTTPVETRLPVGTHSYRIAHPGRREVTGSFDLTSDATKTVEETLPKKAGRLVVQNAPEGAVVHVDGKKQGPAGEAVELDPGRYEISVQAEGFDSFEDTVEIESGETVRRSVPMSPSTNLLRDIPADEIAMNHYIARLSYDQSIHPTSFRDARGDAGGRTYEFQNFATEAGTPPASGTPKRTLSPYGLRLDFAYTGRNFGVVLMSLSYTATRADRRAFVERSGGDEQTVAGTVSSLRRLQLRPLQVSYRHFFQNFVPAVELGTGMTFQWLTMEDLPNASELTLHQTEAFWNLGLTGQYFFDPNWFGMLRYSFQDYFNAGKGVEHVVSLGVGAAFPNVFGFEPEPPEQL